MISGVRAVWEQCITAVQDKCCSLVRWISSASRDRARAAPRRQECGMVEKTAGKSGAWQVPGSRVARVEEKWREERHRVTALGARAAARVLRLS